MERFGPIVAWELLEETSSLQVIVPSTIHNKGLDSHFNSKIIRRQTYLNCYRLLYALLYLASAFQIQEAKGTNFSYAILQSLFAL